MYLSMADIATIDTAASSVNLPHPITASASGAAEPADNASLQSNNSLSTAPQSASAGTEPTHRDDDGLPPAVCSYYANSVQGIGQGCLRVNCKFFHGSEEQLAELRVRCLLDEPLAQGMCAVGAAKRKKPPQEVCSSTKRPIVCLNYLSDACHRQGCRFLHLPPEIRPLPMSTCEYFLRGNCTRDKCRFFHGQPDTLKVLHAQGVTMYNPMTNEAHDPKVPVEELMKGFERRRRLANQSNVAAITNALANLNMNSTLPPLQAFGQGGKGGAARGGAQQQQPQYIQQQPQQQQTVVMMSAQQFAAFQQQQQNASVMVVAPAGGYAQQQQQQFVMPQQQQQQQQQRSMPFAPPAPAGSTVYVVVDNASQLPMQQQVAAPQGMLMGGAPFPVGPAQASPAPAMGFASNGLAQPMPHSGFVPQSGALPMPSNTFGFAPMPVAPPPFANACYF